MTKNLKIISFFVLLVSMFNCTNQKVKPTNLDGVSANFVGKWKGEEKNQQVEGAKKSWEINRKTDGTFVVKFVIQYEGEKPMKHQESGKWWLKDGKYYEYNNLSELTDVYNYEILNEEQIKFSADQLSVEFNNENYEFIDTRVK